MTWGLVAGLAAALLFGVSAVTQAHAVRRRTSATDGLGAFVSAGVRDPLLLAVVVAYLLGFVLHAVSIWLLPLYLAQATISLSLPVTALASRRLSEGLGPRAWWGILAVSLGLLLLAYSSGPPGDVVTTWWFAGALVVATGALALSGRTLGHRSGATLGWLAGLGYAGSAIAVRGIGWPVEPAMVLAALLVPLLGLLAFWLYSVGLERGDVSSSTAPLITAQTFVPALVGLALLGDGVRPGWWPGIALGLLLAVGGSAVVVQDDSGRRGV
jgi:drug/metabolite transporter (DMT)-like permease